MESLSIIFVSPIVLDNLIKNVDTVSTDFIREMVENIGLLNASVMGRDDLLKALYQYQRYVRSTNMISPSDAIETAVAEFSDPVPKRIVFLSESQFREMLSKPSLQNIQRIGRKMLVKGPIRSVDIIEEWIKDGWVRSETGIGAVYSLKLYPEMRRAFMEGRYYPLNVFLDLNTPSSPKEPVTIPPNLPRRVVVLSTEDYNHVKDTVYVSEHPFSSRKTLNKPNMTLIMNGLGIPNIEGMDLSAMNRILVPAFNKGWVRNLKWNRFFNEKNKIDIPEAIYGDDYKPEVVTIELTKDAPPKPQPQPLPSPSLSSKSSPPKFRPIVARKITDKEANRMVSKKAPSYTVENFLEDTKSDAFIQKAIESELLYLDFKRKQYNKLLRFDWGDNVKDKILQAKGQIDERYKTLQNTLVQKLITEKRAALQSIIFDPDNGFNTIHGKARESIKLEAIKMILTFIKLPQLFIKSFQNMVLMGSAGSGKTKLATVLAHVFYKSGINASPKISMSTGENLIASFVGQTASKTKSLVLNYLNGVIFLDEIYSITPCPETDAGKMKSFSEEAIAELINLIDKFQGCFIIIAAGYEDKMSCFFKFNQGIPRRFPKVYTLAPYTSKDLYQILMNALGESIRVNEYFAAPEKDYIRYMIDQLNSLPDIGSIWVNQSGDMVNLASFILEDLVVSDGTYKIPEIFDTFARVALMKNIHIE